MIDGHNVAHAWGWMPGDEAVARSRVIEAGRVLHDCDGVAVVVVFDGRGPRPELDVVGSEVGFSVLYAPEGLTADGAIERLVASSQQSRRWVVVTGDRQIQGNVLASGAEVVEPDEWKARLERVRERSRRRMRRRQSSSATSFGNKLPL